jgi:hypothetical protein
VNRKGQLSHMSMCISDVALYKPTLKIILHLCSSGCLVVRCAGGSTPMESRFELLRVRIQKPADRIRKPTDVFGGRDRIRRRTATVFGGLYSEFRKSMGRNRDSESPRADKGISEVRGPKTEFRKFVDGKRNSVTLWAGIGISEIRDRQCPEDLGS